MNLRTHYNRLYKKSLQHFISDGVEVDSYIDDPKDNRYGLTLIIRPDESVQNKILDFTNQLKIIDPNQYYYPNTDMHITLLSIISCTAGLKLKNIEVEKYVELIRPQLKNIKGDSIKMEGVTASTSCIMIQGYPTNETINKMRSRLRSAFEHSSLLQSLDQRYFLQTAHATTVRFRQPLDPKKTFLQKIEQYKNHNFGTFGVQKLELVYNDWYHRNVDLLHSFEL